MSEKAKARAARIMSAAFDHALEKACTCGTVRHYSPDGLLLREERDEAFDCLIHGYGPCHVCGHRHRTMASASRLNVQRWFCHEDDHSCYNDRRGRYFE